MSLFDRPVPPPLVVEIPHGTAFDPAPAVQEVRETKLKRALAFLGNRWCFADTRRDQIAQIHSDCTDLA